MEHLKPTKCDADSAAADDELWEDQDSIPMARSLLESSWFLQYLMLNPLLSCPEILWRCLAKFTCFVLLFPITEKWDQGVLILSQNFSMLSVNHQLKSIWKWRYTDAQVFYTQKEQNISQWFLLYWNVKSRYHDSVTKFQDAPFSFA